MKKEIWMLIPGYEHYYVSNYGRIKSLAWGKERILSTTKHKQGYLYVTLCKNGKRKLLLIHRLVWEAFNGPIPKHMEINHLNECVWDNRLENLSLVTRKENCNWGTRNERLSVKQKNDLKKSKSVSQYDLNGKLIREWASMREIERETGYAHNNISSCCRGIYKSAYGYLWSFNG